MNRLLVAVAILIMAWQLNAAAPGEASSVQLALTESCSLTQPGRVRVIFTWQGNNPTASQQWVDLSKINNGWQAGTFSGSGALAGRLTNFTWNGLDSKRPYYVRINQLLPGGQWDPSVTYGFTTPDCGGASSPITIAEAQLATLTVQAATTTPAYDRAKFGKAWEDVDQNGCSTRDDMLQRDLKDIVLRAGSTCIVERGTLVDPYTGDTVAFMRGVLTSLAVQIDHVVALAAAWRTGAAAWTDDKRLQFANDPDHLLASDGPTNMAKSDSDAAKWLPPEQDFQCAYVIIQVAIKAKYDLWVTAAEHAKLADVLEDCAPPPAPDGHTWYTSAASTARVYYCELDEGWKNLSPANLRQFNSLEMLLAAFPNRTKSATSKC